MTKLLNIKCKPHNAGKVSKDILCRIFNCILRAFLCIYNRYNSGHLLLINILNFQKDFSMQISIKYPAYRWRSWGTFKICRDSFPPLTMNGWCQSWGWTNMAAVLKLVNRGTLSSAMGQQYLSFSSAPKVQAVSLLSVLLVYSRFIFQQVALCMFS